MVSTSTQQTRPIAGASTHKRRRHCRRTGFDSRAAPRTCRISTTPARPPTIPARPRSDMSAHKDDSRDGRLRFSKRAEQHMRDELALHARSQCQDAMAAFADCAKQHGMMVVLKCRGLNKQMNECLHEYTSEAKFEEWKLKRAEGLEVEGKVVEAGQAK